jgi:hypothetical protein
LAYKEIDPFTGKRKKSGGRVAGSQNVTVRRRHEAMDRVNVALAEIGRDTLSGMKLLQEVLRHPDTPLDVKIQCAGLLTKHESMPADAQHYVVRMPTAMPGTDRQQQLAVWWSLFGETDNDAPEWRDAVKQILELAATRTAPKAIQGKPA